MAQTSKGRVRYRGPHAEGVGVVNPDGSWSTTVLPGEVYETTHDHAALLAEQAENWEPVDRQTKQAAKDGGDS